MKTALNLQPFSFNQLPDPYEVRRANGRRVLGVEGHPHRGDFGGEVKAGAADTGPGVKSTPSTSVRSGEDERGIALSDSAGRQMGGGRGGGGGGKIDATAGESEPESSRGRAAKGSREGDDWTVAGPLCAICSSPLDRERQGEEASVSTERGGGENVLPGGRTPVPLVRGCCTSCNKQVLAPLRAHAELVDKKGEGGTDLAVLSMLPEIVAERLSRA